MTNSPQVSVIMPSYNVEKYIAASIKSVLRQTFTDWELIIIDDCSKDGTVDIINSFGCSRIRLLRNSRNSGAAISRNRGLAEARGRYIAFLDADDIWLPEKLEKQLAYMKEHNYPFTFTDYRSCTDGVWQPYCCTGPDIVTRRMFLNYNYIFTSTVMYDTAVLGVLQGADVKRANDYALWLEAGKKCPACRLPGVYSYYIRHKGTLSGIGTRQLIKRHYTIFRQVLGMNPVMSALFTVNNLFHGLLKKYRYRIPAADTPNDIS